MIWATLASAAWGQAVVDLNTATVQELDALPGLGPAKAEAIVLWRAQHGPCADLAALAEVPGIGQATLAGLRGRARCGPVLEVERDPPAPIDATAPVARPGSVDINSATAAELLTLPGMVASRVRDIIEDRDRNGPFASCAELVRVPRIGPATVANLGDRCTAE